jgi:chorismate synthase
VLRKPFDIARLVRDVRAVLDRQAAALACWSVVRWEPELAWLRAVPRRAPPGPCVSRPRPARRRPGRRMLRRLALQTGGESHGRGMVACLAGLPAGLPFDAGAVDAMLRRRQGGFGRSSRQRLERDRVDVLAGVYRGRTSGAPLVLAVWNRDDSLARRPAFSVPRPGMATSPARRSTGDVDMRPVLERASARETAARVAAGAVAASALAQLGVDCRARVGAGGVSCAPRRARAAASARAGAAIARLRDAGRAAADARCARGLPRGARATRWGRFEVVGFGVPPGLGSLDEPARGSTRGLGARCFIPGVKAVEVGDGVAAAGRAGAARCTTRWAGPGPAARRAPATGPAASRRA